MRWMENAFNLSPDGGSGATELAILIGVGLVVALAVTIMAGRAPRWHRK
jgi:hypothetical protein